MYRGPPLDRDADLETDIERILRSASSYVDDVYLHWRSASRYHIRRQMNRSDDQIRSHCGASLKEERRLGQWACKCSP
jgi:hypothetical protein